MSEPARQPDILLCAHIAVNLALGLSGGARSTAGAILAHWNRRTGQCDPSVERLSTMLGINRATVLRATNELCTGDARLFDKKSHGGKANRATYAPRWDYLRQIVQDWNNRMLTGAPPEKVAKVRRSTSQKCDLERRRNATQTYRSNLLKEPVEAERPKTAPLPAPKKRRHQATPKGQGWLLFPIAGGNASHAQAANTAAERRIFDAIRQQGSDIYAAVCAAATPAMLASAAEAEVKDRGSGAHALLTQVQAILSDERRRTA